MPRIFISYRQGEAGTDAGWLYDQLAERFGKENVFRDIDTLPLGTDWVHQIEDSISRADAVLALIGPGWLGAVDPESGSRRLDDPDDVLRMELSVALRSNCLVIPVLVRGARMPASRELPEDLKPLARRNALVLADPHWKFAVADLAVQLETAFPEDQQQGGNAMHSIPAPDPAPMPEEESTAPPEEDDAYGSRKRLLRQMLSEPHPPIRSFSRLKSATLTTDEECRDLLFEIGARPVTMRGGKEGWALIERYGSG
jgi:hypothetical protein